MAANLINWSSVVSGQIRTVRLFDPVSNPNGDVLRFDDPAISAASLIILRLDSTLTKFSVTVGSKTITLFVDGRTATTSNITFANGSLFLVGDNSYGTGGDDASNTLVGGNGNDQLNGLGGNDILSGGAGADVLADSEGTNTLLGGSGNDIFEINLSVGSASTATGGTGRDAYWLDPESLSLLAAPGSPGNDFLVTDFTVGAGGDGIYLADLVAITIGYVDQDPFAAGFLRVVQSGANTLIQGDRDGATGSTHTWMNLLRLQSVTASQLTSANFPDLFVGTSGDDTLTGTDRDDLIPGLQGNDTLSGQAGKDYLAGGEGNDTLNGGAGADSMTGGRGADTYYVDDAGDVVVEADNTLSGSQGFRADLDLGSATDSVIASIDYTLGSFVENLTLAAGSANLSGAGNSLANVLTGNAGANTLSGGAGSDTLIGGSGNDILNGGDGTDTAEFSGAIGSYTFGVRSSAGITVVSGPDGSDALSSVEFVKFGSAAPVAISSLGSLGQVVSVTRDGVTSYQIATPFSRPPIAGIQIDYEFLGAASGEVAIGTDANDFFNLLGGDDAAAGGTGNDILDGGTGSNFLSGNEGTDTFFLDGRGGTVTWSTITDWQSGEQLSVWGWNASSRVIVWRQDGATGFQGITMHADLNNDGTIDTSVTWTGKAQAELPTPGQFAAQDLLWFT
jgi:Ca2+-binding RTX toxin-like protein